MLAFDHRGLLPPGDYPMNLNDLKKSLLLVGPTGIVWDREWRLKLVQNLHIMVNQLWLETRCNFLPRLELNDTLMNLKA